MNPKLYRYQSRLTIALTALIVVGAIQYVNSASLSLSSGSDIFWVLDDSITDQAGPLKYAKDALLVIFGTVWPFLIWNKFSGALRSYGLWILSVILLGSLSIITGRSYLFIYVSGLRWMMLLHASVGTYMLIVQYGLSRRSEVFLLKVALLISAINVFFILKQSPNGLPIFSGARLTGIFSNSATAGFFALSMSLLTFAFYRSSSLPLLVLLNVLSFLVAMGSGTRSAIIGVILITGFIIVERNVHRATVNVKPVIFAVIALLALPSVVGALALSDTVSSRGDVFADQLLNGGRLYNLSQLPHLIMQSSAGDLLFGQGLGVGTATASNMQQFVSYGDDMTFNTGIDNTFVTTFFQIGVVGSVVFWGGITQFIKHHISWRMMIILFILVMHLFATYLFEQYFLMIGLSFVFAAERLRRTAIASNQFIIPAAIEIGTPAALSS